MLYFKKLGLVMCLLILSLSSWAQSGQTQCLTWSSQILFMSIGDDEQTTADTVINGCVANEYTIESECIENLNCFPYEK